MPRLVKQYQNSWLEVGMYYDERMSNCKVFGIYSYYYILVLNRQTQVKVRRLPRKEALEFFRKETKMAKQIDEDIQFYRKAQELLEDDKEKNTPAKPPALRVITGGGSTYDNPNWLEELPEQTVFLAKDKYMVDQHGNRTTSNQIDLEKYTLVLKYTKAAWLSLHLVDRIVDPVYVDMLQFSLRKQFIEAIVE